MSNIPDSSPALLPVRVPSSLLGTGAVPDDDPHKESSVQTFHVAPRSGWGSDPHGIIRWKGRYHLFYQARPGTCQWYWGMQWDHCVSTDLVHWARLPPAVVPTPGGLDADGCFTGNIAVHPATGVPIMFYTGARLRHNPSVAFPEPPENARHPLMLHWETQLCAVADPDDELLVRWTKVATPWMDLPHCAYLTSWRDPFFVPPRLDPATGQPVTSRHRLPNGTPAVEVTENGNQRDLTEADMNGSIRTYEDVGTVDGSEVPVTVQEKDASSDVEESAGLENEDDEYDEEGVHTMLIGSGLEGLGGTALIYRSADLAKGWRFDGYLCTWPNTDTGLCWECPSLQHLPDLPPGLTCLGQAAVADVPPGATAAGNKQDRGTAEAAREELARLVSQAWAEIDAMGGEATAAAAAAAEMSRSTTAAVAAQTVLEGLLNNEAAAAVAAAHSNAVTAGGGGELMSHQHSPLPHQHSPLPFPTSATISASQMLFEVLEDTLMQRQQQQAAQQAACEAVSDSGAAPSSSTTNASSPNGTEGSEAPASIPPSTTYDDDERDMLLLGEDGGGNEEAAVAAYSKAQQAYNPSPHPAQVTPHAPPSVFASEAVQTAAAQRIIPSPSSSGSCPPPAAAVLEAEGGDELSPLPTRSSVMVDEGSVARTRTTGAVASAMAAVASTVGSVLDTLQHSATISASVSTSIPPTVPEDQVVVAGPHGHAHSAPAKAIMPSVLPSGGSKAVDENRAIGSPLPMSISGGIGTTSAAHELLVGAIMEGRQEGAAAAAAAAAATAVAAAVTATAKTPDGNEEASFGQDTSAAVDAEGPPSKSVSRRTSLHAGLLSLLDESQLQQLDSAVETAAAAVAAAAAAGDIKAAGEAGMAGLGWTGVLSQHAPAGINNPGAGSTAAAMPLGAADAAESAADTKAAESMSAAAAGDQQLLTKSGTMPRRPGELPPPPFYLPGMTKTELRAACREYAVAAAAVQGFDLGMPETDSPVVRQCKEGPPEVPNPAQPGQRHLLVLAPDAATYSILYFIGDYVNGRFQLGDSTGPYKMDLGNVLYAPVTFYDQAHGRHLTWGYLKELRDQPAPPSMCNKYINSGCVSLPRALYLRDGRLHQVPIPEMSSLRSGECWHAGPAPLEPVNPLAVPSRSNGGISSDHHLDVELVARRGTSQQLVLWLDSWRPGQRGAGAITFDWESKVLKVVYDVLPSPQGLQPLPSPLDSAANTARDTTMFQRVLGGGLHSVSDACGTSYDVYIDPKVPPVADMNPDVPDWIRMKLLEAGGKLCMEDDDDALQLRIFIDGSAVEIFTGSGEVVSTRMYRGVPPDNNSEASNAGIELWSYGGTCQLESFDVHETHTTWVRGPADAPVEPPVNLNALHAIQAAGLAAA